MAPIASLVFVSFAYKNVLRSFLATVLGSEPFVPIAAAATMTRTDHLSL
jgi:hypothetical protein